MAALKIPVWLGRDNVQEIRLTEAGATINHGLITRVVLDLGAELLDSDDAPALFVLGEADSISLALGDCGLDAGHYAGQLITYDADHANGLVWADIELTVK